MDFRIVCTCIWSFYTATMWGHVTAIRLCFLFNQSLQHPQQSLCLFCKLNMRQTQARTHKDATFKINSVWLATSYNTSQLRADWICSRILISNTLNSTHTKPFILLLHRWLMVHLENSFGVEEFCTKFTFSILYTNIAFVLALDNKCCLPYWKIKAFYCL